MSALLQSVPARRAVVAHLCDPPTAEAEHERRSLLGFVTRIAALLELDDGGVHDPALHRDADPFFVPDDTLTAATAKSLGIVDLDDVLGGVVPHAFVGTKAISHPLVRPGAACAAGWNEDFAVRVAPVVLGGFTAFDAGDAIEAGTRLLDRSAVRIKRVQARGGMGQVVVRDAASLREAIEACDGGEIAAHGIVLEEDLDELMTFSVGQVRLGPLCMSYHGRQRHTRGNDGAEVFGGSDLAGVRGGFDELLAVVQDQAVHRAVEEAMQYHDAAHACYPGLFASRANYDVLLGRDAGGSMRSAVLEQSWRVGGATGAEIALLEALQADPTRTRASASCFEVYGDSVPPPSHATVYFRGVDADVGPLTKFTVLQPDDGPR